jgi:hypothetical protein
VNVSRSLSLNPAWIIQLAILAITLTFLGLIRSNLFFSKQDMTPCNVELSSAGIESLSLLETPVLLEFDEAGSLLVKERQGPSLHLRPMDCIT